MLKNKKILMNNAEYLQKMKDIMNDFRTGSSGISYPSNIKKNFNAQAFYGVVVEVLSAMNNLTHKDELLGELALLLMTYYIVHNLTAFVVRALTEILSKSYLKERENHDNSPSTTRLTIWSSMMRCPFCAP